MTQRRGFHKELAARLRLAHERRETGLLRAVIDESAREMHLRKGRVVGARTSVEDERIGSLLVKEGLVTRQQLEDASVFVQHGRRLGETLVELRLLEPAEIPPIVRRQVLQISCSMVNAEGAEFRFRETSDAFTTLQTPLLVTDVIMEAARRVDDVDLLLEGFRADAHRFHPSKETLVTEICSATPGDVYLISRFRGGATVGEILRSTDADIHGVARSLLGLIASGTLSPSEPKPAVAASENLRLDPFFREVDRMHRILETKDPWSALGLSRDVGVETARSAFRNALRRYHPDRYQKAKDAELQRKLASLCSKFADAYKCLTTALQKRSANEESAIARASTWRGVTAASMRPDSTDKRASRQTRMRAEPNRTGGADVRVPSEPAPKQESSSCARALDGGPCAATPAYDAGVYFREGKRALSLGDYWRAIQLLQRSLEMKSDDAEAHYLLGEALFKNPKWRHEAENSFERAIALEPWQRKYYEGLVRLYRAAGLYHRAERRRRQAEAIGIHISASGPKRDETRESTDAG